MVKPASPSTADPLELPSDRAALARADFISQTTAVEQARAVAEVQAAVIVAQQCPRNMPSAIAEMRQSCAQIGLAERAFFKFPKGGSSVSGPSVHLARELARCFGNIDYGIRELRRDEIGHYSEMQAWAWDVERNTRSTLNFVVPHKRDKRGVAGGEVLTDLRDVYENNANMGARRLREAIFSVLPTWFAEEAKALCTATLEGGEGEKPLPQRIADAVRVFDGLGIKADRLEAKIGSPQTSWTAQDLAGLRVSLASIKQGTVSADDEFPPVRVTVAELTEGAAA
jgi:hypothetical protein